MKIVTNALLTVAFLTLAACSPNQTKTVETKPATIDTTVTQEPSKSVKEERVALSIGVTPEEFTDSFNKHAQETNTKLRITHLKIEEGPVNNTFSYKIAENLAITGAVSKSTGEILGINFIGGSDKTLENAEYIFIASTLFISATQPDANIELGKETMEKLGVLDSDVDASNIDSSVVVNGIKYFVVGDKHTGLIFGASNANAE
ncbi:hypothetical protein P4H61_08345 [Paenibacillus peoriae]|uniref:hypothetical protein n=1 Tax=Paenibacillus peoriae TaxID=59893 RepID=UPI00026C562F|nr:hypothetical protein [Paenibacillus peoriae]MEC0181509.1 hypothetical protein [Paenibacillus peoriae]